MQFILIAYDKADGLKLRMETRPAHVRYWEGVGADLLFGGPLLAEDGSSKGSILVVNAADAQAAKIIFDNDPYIAAGLFDRLEITPFRHVFTNGVVQG